MGPAGNGIQSRPKKEGHPFWWAHFMWFAIPVSLWGLFWWNPSKFNPLLGLVAAAVGVYFIIVPFMMARANRIVDAAAHDLGLRKTRKFTFPKRAGTYLEGVVEGFEVSLTSTFLLRVAVDGAGRKEGPLPLGLTLIRRPEEGDAPPGKRFYSLGDPKIDDRFLVGGPRAAVLAALGAEVRRQIRETLDLTLNITIEEGRILYDNLGFNKSSNLPECIRHGVRLAGAIAEAVRDIPATLAANVREDPLVEVSRFNLEVLARDYPQNPHTAAALEAALQSPYPPLRLEAATHAGEEGFEMLKKLVYDKGTAVELKADALTRLAANFPADRVTPLIAASLRSDSDPLLAAALRAVKWCRLHTLEGEVIAALRRSRKVRRAAVAALAKVGTTLAVAPLRALEKDARLDIGNRREVRGAIEEIQGRLHGAGEGQVSLTEAGVQGGRVSLPDEDGEEGRLTLDGKKEPPIEAKGEEG